MVSSTSVFQTPAERVERESSKLLHRSGYSWATVSETEVDCAATPLTVVVPVMGMV